MPTRKCLTEVHIMKDCRDVPRIVGANKRCQGATAGSITLELKEGSRQAGNVMRAGARRNKNPCQHTSPSGAMQV